MRKFLAYSTSGFVLLTAAAFAQSSQPDEKKLKISLKTMSGNRLKTMSPFALSNRHQTDSAILKLILLISMATYYIFLAILPTPKNHKLHVYFTYSKNTYVEK